jgi:hypothetical protein
VIIDTHSHAWKPEFMTGQFRADMEKFFREGNRAGADRVTGADWDDHQAAMRGVIDRVIVFGLRAEASGIMVPNDYIAEYARRHPGQVVGYCSVDPRDPNALAELERSHGELGLKGLKLGPIYQDVHPHDLRVRQLYRRCADLNMPVIFHQGSTTPRQIRLALASPLLIEDIAIEFPDLRLHIAHLGHPWMTETIQVLRKQPNVFSDISCLWPRPWQLYNALVLAQEYGVIGQIVFGSDFPFGTARETIASLQSLNHMVEGTNLPRIRDETVAAIIHHNAERIYGFLWE